MSVPSWRELNRWAWRRGPLAARAAAFPALLAALTALAACSGGWHVGSNSSVTDPATVDYPVFYVKRQVPVDQAGLLQQDDLRLLRPFTVATPTVTATTPTADLYMRASASPVAPETNITTRITAGQVWDVKDVDTSADGSRVIFAMRGPLTPNQKAKDPPSWRIYEYVIATDTLHPVIDPSTDPDPPTVNDVSPHYLPDGRIVFSTTRQTQSEGILLDEHKPQFAAQDEARQEPAFVLEVMNADGTDVHQISFNQSHDRDATVLANGRVMWTRWDNSPGHDAMSFYSANPDGTDLELYYGANSHMTGTNNTVVEFVRPHQMLDGRILAIMRQYTDVDDGGALVIIDGEHYVDNAQPLLAYPTLAGPAQTAATANDVYTIPGPSPGGRYIAAYPLLDGTDRILVSWSQCRLLDTTQTPPAIVPCTSTALAQPNVQVALPLYSVWLFDPTQNTLDPIMPPVEGVMVSDVAVAQPRPVPTIINDAVPGVGLDENLLNAGVGVIDIRSVYDIDGVDTAVPNIAALADPVQTPPAQRPARFIRLEKAVSIPDKTVVNLSNAAFGASNFMIEILGYAPIEPDGSVHIEVPGDVAFRMSVLDAEARRITPVQGVWLQVKPGEVVNCNGCHLPQQGAQKPHSHGRQGLFASAWAGAAVSGAPFPHTIAAGAGAFIPQAGETMAQARMRVSCLSDNPPCQQQVPGYGSATLNPGGGMNVLYFDVWTDPAQATPGTPITLRYDDPTQFFTAIPTTALCVTQWASNCRIIINYPEHLQPLWDAPRPNPPVAGVNNTCTQGGCHSPKNAAGMAQMPAGNLDLTNSASQAEPQQFTSYQELLFPHTITVPAPTPTNPNATTTVTVGPYMNAGAANGALSQQFFACVTSGAGCMAPVAHAGFMTAAELRLVDEWLDIGAQYFNNPFDPMVPVN
jgi:Hydrazine synthase alpha subunit middle domain